MSSEENQPQTSEENTTNNCVGWKVGFWLCFVCCIITFIIMLILFIKKRKFQEIVLPHLQKRLSNLNEKIDNKINYVQQQKELKNKPKEYIPLMKKETKTLDSTLNLPNNESIVDSSEEQLLEEAKNTIDVVKEKQELSNIIENQLGGKLTSISQIGL